MRFLPIAFEAGLKQTLAGQSLRHSLQLKAEASKAGLKQTVTYLNAVSLHADQEAGRKLWPWGSGIEQCG